MIVGASQTCLVVTRDIPRCDTIEDPSRYHRLSVGSFVNCSLLLLLVDSTRGLSGRRCQVAQPGLRNTRAGDHERGCGPLQVMHGRMQGQRGWSAGCLGSRCCRIEDPEKRHVRSLTPSRSRRSQRRGVGSPPVDSRWSSRHDAVNSHVSVEPTRDSLGRRTST